MYYWRIEIENCVTYYAATDGDVLTAERAQEFIEAAEGATFEDEGWEPVDEDCIESVDPALVHVRDDGALARTALQLEQAGAIEPDAVFCCSEWP